MTGKRQRYRLLDKGRLLESLGGVREQQLREWYVEAVVRRIAEATPHRESHWTDSLAVGSQGFVERTQHAYTNRLSFDSGPVTGENGALWAVRESALSYTPVLKAKSDSNA